MLLPVAAAHFTSLILSSFLLPCPIRLCCRELSKLRASLSGLVDVSTALRKQLDGGVSALATRLTPRLRSALNVFEGASSLIQYELTEEAFANTQASDDAITPGAVSANAFTAEFLPVLAAVLAPYQYSLTPSLAIALVTKVAVYVAKQLEPRIRRKRFNQLGGIQFDADMRALAAFFAARSSRRVRDKFARLLHMAALLNLDAPAEIPAYIVASSNPAAPSGGSSGSGGGSSGIAGWQLSAEEVKAVASLRSDWAPADIARLQL